ncbi:MAG TPA: transporter [Firmicutes bacterium]|jgi:iron complex transport system substrate-binding protein|nr:transporter [Bacillota bacterium]
MISKMKFMFFGLNLLIFSLMFATATDSKIATREIVDMNGRKVGIPLKVTRVVGTGGAVDEWILLLGSPEKLVAISNAIKTNPWYIKAYPEIKAVPAPIGSSGVNIEELLKTKPDVAILLSGMSPMQSKIEKSGIPFVVLERRNPEELMRGIELTGQILGTKEAKRAAEFCSYYRANIRRVLSKTASLPEDRRFKVYCGSGIKPLATEGKESIVTSWIEMAGGKNVAAENGLTGMSQAVSMENIIAWNPDVIITSPEGKNAILNDSSWSVINAVKKNRIYINPKGVYSWGVRSADEALQVLWAAKVLHPELFLDLDMLQEVKLFHKKYYNYKMSDEDVKRMLNAEPPKEVEK